MESEYPTPWGRITVEKIKKYSILSLLLFFIITSYWIMKSIKDPIFSYLVGMQYQPFAKIISVIMIFPMLVLYNFFLNIFNKQINFYIFSFIYSVIFFSIAYFFDNWNIDNSIYHPLGWICYFACESFGSIMVALFWAFTTGESNTDEGKKYFPIIIFTAQLGSIAGPTLATFAPEFGLPFLLRVTASIIMIIPINIIIYKILFIEKSKRTLETKSKTGLFEGIKIIFRSKYVMGIVGITCFHEMVYTILDFQMKMQASLTYSNAEELAVFMGRFGQATNVFAFLWAFFGSSYLLRTLGIRFCLLLYPISVLFLVILLSVNNDLWTFFYALVFYRVLNYALNNPTKEILYIPTTEEVRYKSKSWIDAFAARGSKAIGSGITQLSISLAASSLGLLSSLLIISTWIYTSLFVSKKFNLHENKEKFSI